MIQTEAETKAGKDQRVAKAIGTSYPSKGSPTYRLSAMRFESGRTVVKWDTAEGSHEKTFSDTTAAENWDLAEVPEGEARQAVANTVECVCH